MIDIQDRIDKIAEDVSVILYILKGNGSEGLVTKVCRHESFIAGFIGGGKILAVLSLLCGLVFSFIRVLS